MHIPSSLTTEQIVESSQEKTGEKGEQAGQEEVGPSSLSFTCQLGSRFEVRDFVI